MDGYSEANCSISPEVTEDVHCRISLFWEYIELPKVTEDALFVKLVGFANIYFFDAV